MSIIAMIGLMVVTLGAAYALWSLLLRAERVFAQLEGHGQTAADVAGVAFLALAAVIVLSASAALLFEARRLVSAILAV
jgi:multisubunit Na+/H+ antiporter MnhG subunit